MRPLEFLKPLRISRAKGHAPEGVEITVYRGLGNLTHFYPHVEGFAPFSVNSNRRYNSLEISKDPKALKRPIPASGITVFPPEQISRYKTLPKLYGKFMTSLRVEPKLLYAGRPVLTGRLA